MINKSMLLAMTCGLSLAFMSCENQKFNDTYADAERVHLDTLSAEMQKVRDYVPELAVVAHRGSTYWAPEETESAYRWARETGADYLEADLQVSKDGVILALHDTDLKRTTNIEDVFGERFPEAERYYYYTKLLNYSDAEAKDKIAADKEAFVPNYPCSYTYYELLMLDAGTWFNEDEASLEQARTGFTTHYQYISTLEDLIMFSKGYRLQRYGEAGAPAAGDIDFWTKYGSRDGSTPSAAGHRVVVSLTPHPDETFSNPVNYRYDGTALTETVVTYDFEYVKDEKHSGNIPGIYIEFKEPWLNPSTFEQMVYDELTEIEDMNIIEKPCADDVPFYTADGYVNVGNTNGKVILQTFSMQSLARAQGIFKGQVPMCFLLWKGTAATDLQNDDPQGYASFINLGIELGAHYMGPSIAGAPNNYDELNYPWQHDMIHRAKMENHPYSFDTYDQMAKYFGLYNWGTEGGTRYEAPYLDAFFTNHTDMSLQFMYDHNFRDASLHHAVPDARQLLDELGYER